MAGALKSPVSVAVVGGTSAGLAILGSLDYSAKNGSITSAQALADPYDTRTEEPNSNVLIAGVPAITDSHFQERDRMGRLLALVVRSGINGLGVNEGTAVLYSLSGDVEPGAGKDAKIVGASSAYFVTSLGVTSCVAGSPLDATFRVRRFSSGTLFNFADGWIDDPTAYVLIARNGAITSTQT